MGITTGAYFSPHLMEQPYFQRVCVGGPLPVCDEVSARMLSLPLFDSMTHEEVDQVVECLHIVVGAAQGQRRTRRSPSQQRLPVAYRSMTRATEGIAVE